MKHLESTVFKGTSVFAFGGARSHDIAGLASEEELAKDYTAGILQKDDPHLYGKLKLAGNYFSYCRINLSLVQSNISQAHYLFVRGCGKAQLDTSPVYGGLRKAS